MTNTTVDDPVWARSGKCPTATQDVKENTKNRDWTIENFGYGPLNPDNPDPGFWEGKAGLWKTKVEVAKTALCGNCAAFDQTPRVLGCIVKGVNEKGTVANPEHVQRYGNLGYCQLFKFKCAGERTCDAWVHGGPIQ
tara:strand:+ start:55 stop:465 length:411 start_codon:yes stop_codon:yes gene_type:complete